jgi:hypothetical protein
MGDDLGKKRCAARHHDWSDAGHCRRSGCMATRTQPKPAPLMLSAVPVDRMPKPINPPKAPEASDPISKLRAKVSPTPGPAQADQVIPPGAKPDENPAKADGEFLDDDFLPAVGGPIIVGAHIGLTAKILKKMGRTCEPPDDDRKDKATTKVSAWLKIKLGNTITLGPTGQMFACLAGLSATMYLDSDPIANTPPPPPPPKPAQPSAAPAPVVATPSPPVGPTARPAPIARDSDPILSKDTSILFV